MTFRRFALAISTSFGIVVGTCVASAQSPEAFYKGKTISVMIGYGVGGSDDLWARIIAKHMGDHMPGHPAVVPINVPGAGSLRLANQIYNKEAKDGTVIGLINRGILFEPMLGGEGIHFDPLKLTFIGSPDRDTAVCVARKDAQVQNWQDLNTKELIVGATGSGADTAVYPNFLNNMLKLKFKIVSGYTGSKEINLAVERNEVQGICVSYDTIARENIFKSGLVHILFQAALKPDPRLKDVPSVTDFAKTDEERAAIQLFLERTVVGRPFIAPTGTSEERLQVLRDAFEETLKDPALIEEAEKAGLHPLYISPDELRNIVDDAYKVPAAVVAVTKKALGR